MFSYELLKVLDKSRMTCAYVFVSMSNEHAFVLFGWVIHVPLIKFVFVRSHWTGYLDVNAQYRWIVEWMNYLSLNV